MSTFEGFLTTVNSQVCIQTSHSTKVGKGKESDPTDASVDTSANASVDTPPTHYRHVGRHTTDTSADTLPTRWPTRRPTHY